MGFWLLSAPPGGARALFSMPVLVLSVLALGTTLALVQRAEQLSETGWKNRLSHIVWVLFGLPMALVLAVPLYHLIRSPEYTLWSCLRDSVCALVVLPVYLWPVITRRNRAVHNLSLKGKAASDQERYQQAQELFQSAWSEARRVWFRRQENIAACLYNLAFLNWRQGKVSEAETFLDQMLAKLDDRKHSSSEALRVGVDLRAAIYTDRRQYAAALPLLERSLKLWRKAKGERSPETALALHKLAAMFGQMGRHAVAVDLVAQAVKVHEACGGQADLAAALVDLGLSSSALGEHEEAERTIQRAVQLQESRLGPDHPDVATALLNLGVVYSAQRLWDKALAVYQRALAIRERRHGPEHVALAIPLNNIDDAYCGQKQYDLAEGAIERALGIWDFRG